MGGGVIGLSSETLKKSTFSCAQGILLIAARRPYDLGDRVCIVGSEVLVDPDPNNSWFVEGEFDDPSLMDIRQLEFASLSHLLSSDINLFCTTLRFAPSNQGKSTELACVAMVLNVLLSNLLVDSPHSCNRQ